ncbi:MAG TPA: helix-turn-helix transcriptional regulator [Kofleriaceae bacterium]|nr:helix-turn-helix transcriptional regulator [Kofleriaceae bacterium]
MTIQKYVGGSGQLHVGQVHQLIRLLGEAREIPVERPERGYHLVSGVGRIVGAAVVSVILDTDSVQGDQLQRSVTVLFERDGGASLGLEQLSQAASALQPLVLAMVRLVPREPGATVTAPWQELATERRWCCVEKMVHYLRPPGCGDAMFSAVRLRTSSQVHGLGLYRGPEGQAFNEEERNLLHVFHVACAGLLLSSLPSTAGGGDQDAGYASLSLRQRQTLDLVLDGLSDKEIAGRLRISRFTVNQYTKAIYRHYGVTSRIQLLARLLGQSRAAHSLIIGTGVVSAAP